ncbi:MAG: helix-turn-helix transcriptional regulator [Syntrophobacteraceae bacterium]
MGGCVVISQFSRGALAAIIQIVQESLDITSENDLSRVIDTLRNAFPFRHAIMCSIMKSGCGSPVSHFINYNYNCNWIQLYMENEYYRIDPILRHGMRAQEPFLWRVAYSQHMDDDKVSHFIRRANDFNLYDGIAFACHTRNSACRDTLISLEMGREKTPKHLIEALQILLPHIHEAYNRICRRTELRSDQKDLTCRETEILKWARDGKSSWEISHILGISQRTVKFHLSNVFQKLDVVNRAQAVARAMNSGLI